MDDPDLLVERYLAALEAADLDAVLALFAPDATVVSPLYGTQPARAFYPVLFADTAESRLTLKATMRGTRDGGELVSFWFDFDWTLASGEPAPFSVVDVAELDEADRAAHDRLRHRPDPRGVRPAAARRPRRLRSQTDGLSRPSRPAGPASQPCFAIPTRKQPGCADLPAT